MQDHYAVIEPNQFSAAQAFRDKFALDVLMGLSSPRKFLPSRYFYDAEGSRLFEEITRQPEYYLTDCEEEILERHAGDLALALDGEPINLVELGAGDGHKTEILLEALSSRGVSTSYVPIDISESAVANLTAKVVGEYAGVECSGLVGDYFDAIRWMSGRDPRRSLILFLGSTIGNFNPSQTRVFLQTLWNAMKHRDLLLIGFDLVKEIDVMMRAYDDAAGVTRAFNLNLLERINRELGGDFDVAGFQHYGTWDVLDGAMKSYLVSRRRQTVHIGALGRSFDFEAWEPMHVESSYKMLESDLDGLAADTGYTPVARYTDSRGYFVDSLWCADRNSGQEPGRS